MANQQAGDMQSEASENRSVARNTLPHVLVLCGSVIYPIVFLPLYRMIGAAAFAFSFPVSAFAGWLWGVRGGVFFAVVLSFINVGLGIALGVEVFESVVSALAGLVVMLLMGGIVGRLRESTDRTRQEIAERRRAEETLRESEERFRQLSDAAFEGIVIHDRGTILDANSSFCQMYGYDRSEVIGKSALDLTAPGYRDLVRQKIASGDTQPYEGVALRKDGTAIPVELAGKPITYQGRVVRVTAIRDIAGRTRAEDALRESEERYRTLADAAHDMIFIINRDGNVEYVNIFAASIFNRRPEELIGKPLGALFPTDTLERQRRSLRGVIETLEPHYAEQLTSFPERDLWLGTWLVPLKNEAGQARAVLGISRDITERRRTEEAEREQRMLAEALRDTAAALNSSLNFDEILERVLANVDRVVPHDTADIMLIESGVAHIVRSRGYSERGEDHLVGLRFTVADVPNFRRMAETGQPVVIADALADPQWVIFPETRWIRSYVGAPICVKEQVIGFLNLDSATPGFFTTAHAERLHAFADQAATALDNARLLAESRQRLRVLEALQQASLAFTQLLRPEAVGLNIIETVERLLGYRRSSVWITGKSGHELDLLAHSTMGLSPDKFPVELVRIQSLGTRSGMGIIGWVAKHGEPVRTGNVKSDPRYLEGDPAIQSELCVPLKVGGRTIGAFNVESEKADAFSEHDELFLTTLASQAAVAIENARLFEETRQRASYQAALNAIIVAPTTQVSTDLEALLKIALEQTLQVLNLNMGVIWLEPTSGGAPRIVSSGLPQEIGAVPFGIARDGQLAILHTQAISDWRDEDHALAPIMEHFGVRASITVPLLSDGQRIGEMGVAASLPRQWSAEEIDLIGAVGHQLGATVERARLFEETRQRLAELEAVNRVSTALRAAQTLDEMLPLLLDETLAVLGADAGTISLYDSAHDELRKGVSRGWYAKLRTASLARPRERIGGHIFESSEPYVVREFVSDPHTPESMRSYAPAGWGGATVPIRSVEQIVGVLHVAVQLPRELQPSETRLLTTLSEIAGNAIQRTRLHQQTEQRLQHLTALRDIDRVISSSLDLRLSLATLIEQTISQLHVDAVDLLLLTPGSLTLDYVAGRGFHTSGITQTHLHLGEGHAGRAALEGRLIHIPDITLPENTPARAALLQGEGFAAYIGVPLIAKGMVKGVLEIFHRAPLRLDEEWLDFLATLAQQAAIAVENMQLFHGLQQSNMELSLAYDATIEGWSHALDLRDKETEGHTQRVTEMTLRLARAMGLGEEEMVHIRRGALLHDIGKMGVPDSILLKPGGLTDDEWIVMRKHPTYAYELLYPIHYLRSALDIPYCHHEKWDGTGYPRGLKGEQIPLVARIFAVVDMYDALCADRPYRGAWPEERVGEYIREQSGRHFDPKVVEAFLQIEGELRQG